MLRGLFSHAQGTPDEDGALRRSARQRRAGVITIAVGFLLPASFAIANPASAHTPEFGVDCSTAWVTLAQYNAGVTNTITVTTPGKTLIPTTTFGSSYNKTVVLPSHSQPIDVTFKVVAGDGPDNPHWSMTKTLWAPVCTQTTTSSTTTPPTTTTKPPTTTTTPPTTTKPPTTTTSPPTTTTTAPPTTTPPTTTTTPPPTSSTPPSTTGTPPATTTAPPTPTTAGVPTAVDACGTSQDTYAIPATTGVRYYVGEALVPAGVHSATGTVTVTAAAAPGYTLTGPSSWSFTWTNAACLESGTATKPVAHDVCGTGNDTFTLPPASDDYTYTVNGVTTAAGTYAARGVVNVVAVPAAGYQIVGDSAWTYTFTNVSCAAVDSTLAYTGASVKLPLLAGGLLVIAGGGFLFAARRRQV